MSPFPSPTNGPIPTLQPFSSPQSHLCPTYILQMISLFLSQKKENILDEHFSNSPFPPRHLRTRFYSHLFISFPIPSSFLLNTTFFIPSLDLVFSNFRWILLSYLFLPCPISNPQNVKSSSTGSVLWANKHTLVLPIHWRVRRIENREEKE